MNFILSLIKNPIVIFIILGFIAFDYARTLNTKLDIAKQEIIEHELALQITIDAYTNNALIEESKKDLEISVLKKEIDLKSKSEKVKRAVEKRGEIKNEEDSSFSIVSF